jgi:RNA-directed DNA polymerase
VIDVPVACNTHIPLPARACSRSTIRRCEAFSFIAGGGRRVLQEAQLLEPIFEPTFSANSYGFRPGRSQHQAVMAAREIVAAGKPYVVDLDLSQFFDRIHHDRLIARVGEQVPDKRILRLIGMTLRSGVMADGLKSPTTEGAVQGSPLSPLLSNVVLDELDRELERRSLAFCRFADDCNIFVRTPKAAERVMASIGGYIETRLKLVVNREKSQVARSDRVKFLGFTIVGETVAIAHKALQGAMAKVKELTPRGTHLRLEDTIERINSWYVGWSSYFALTNYPAQLHKIEAHIRRRLRSRLIDQPALLRCHAADRLDSASNLAVETWG